jgi:hypothetical protein
MIDWPFAKGSERDGPCTRRRLKGRFPQRILI